MGLHLKKQNAFDQIIRNHYGSALKSMTRVKETLEKTVDAELPLINVKITQMRPSKNIFIMLLLYQIQLI